MKDVDLEDVKTVMSEPGLGVAGIALRFIEPGEPDPNAYIE